MKAAGEAGALAKGGAAKGVGRRGMRGKKTLHSAPPPTLASVGVDKNLAKSARWHDQNRVIDSFSNAACRRLRAAPLEPESYRRDHARFC